MPTTLCVFNATVNWPDAGAPLPFQLSIPWVWSESDEYKDLPDDQKIPVHELRADNSASKCFEASDNGTPKESTTGACERFTVGYNLRNDTSDWIKAGQQGSETVV
ncbi:MAG: hypothetical protein M1833_003358 [Piccolia ochrophora]|nr:MAG: hypothetical protein M1833_003358 [Piccolia ochrophora]